MQNHDATQVTLVVVGDGSVGKTCMLVSYTQDKFPVDYVPTVFENYTTQIKVDQTFVNLSLWDTAGQEAYREMRKISYGQAEVFVVVFSVVDQDTFGNVVNSWLKELSEGPLKDVPKLIVGNKTDLRDASNPSQVQKQAAQQVFKDKGYTYLECSARSQEGLKEVFEEAVRLRLNQKKQSQSNMRSLLEDKNKKQHKKDEQVSENVCVCQLQ